jgi:hypothetical protein
MVTGLESVLVYVACEKNISLIRLFCPLWDHEGDHIEQEMRMWDHIFVLVYVLAFSVVVAQLFDTLTGLLVPMVVVCCVLFVFVSLFHAGRLRSLATLATRTAAEDMGGVVEGKKAAAKEGALVSRGTQPNGTCV